MKKINLLLLLLLPLMSFSQNQKFIDAMTRSLEEMSNAATAEAFLAVSNRFERIALAEKTEWLPYYYAAYARSVSAFIAGDKSKVDEVLDVAQKLVDVADSLSPDNSEIVLMKAMVLAGRISVDPMSRGMQYGMQSGMLMQRAITLDDSNPRSYYMMGQSLFYTPEQFGGGKEAGCNMLEIAREKYATFQPASSIHPTWGEEQLVELLKQCAATESNESGE
ncbi:MAG: hypothetical protein ABR95_13830 [Sphingobacteriales bacterium BACL12 MAG-120813-bin55]|jgi:hypothetical protein|nr:MAG: hypothetical protein ABR94_05620 [Sphingobacteriales bacterium BACL12 MAG-120802-bin5]KRP09192.1 MAG: hypothetical protein ABR95_13830 [Sphingobacteriales bacterium BACL12 MAG-120813-bin55]